MTEKIYLETSESVLGSPIFHYHVIEFLCLVNKDALFTQSTFSLLEEIRRKLFSTVLFNDYGDYHVFLFYETSQFCYCQYSLI